MPTIETVETCHDKAATMTCFVATIKKHSTINLLRVSEEGNKTSEDGFDGHDGDSDGHDGDGNDHDGDGDDHDGDGHGGDGSHFTPHS